MSYLLPTVILALVICANRIPAPPALAPLSAWRVIPITDDNAHPLQAPVLLADAVLWRPFEGGGLRYQSLDGTHQYQHDWLYGAPVQWSAIETLDAILLGWRTGDQRLWIARLYKSGEQQSAPISITPSAQDFRLVGLDDGRAVIYWLYQRDLYMREIDWLGRPRQTALLQQHVDMLAAAGESLSWRSGETIFAGKLDIETRTVINVQVVTTLTEETADLFMLNAGDSRILLWGARSGALLPLNGMADPVLFELALPGKWANVSGDQAIFDMDQQPVQVSFNTYGAVGYRVIEGAPITGSPASILGQHGAWVTLDEVQMPHLYITTLDSRLGELVYPAEADWREAMRQGLQASYLGLLWLIAPLISLYFTGKPTPIFLALYWVSKTIFSLGLFSFYSPVLLAAGVSPLLALVLITLFSAALALTGKFRYPTFCLTDMILTFAILGSHVELSRLFG